MLRGEFDWTGDAAVVDKPQLAAEIRNDPLRDLRVKADTDREEREGIEAAKDRLGHASSTMTRHDVRHLNGKLVK